MRTEHLPPPGTPAAVEAGCRCWIWARQYASGERWIPLWSPTRCPLHDRTPQPAGYQDVAEPLEEGLP